MMPTDSMFLLSESREHPMHVGGLQLYEPPEGAGPEFVREFYERLVANEDFQPTFLKHPATFLGGIGEPGLVLRQGHRRRLSRPAKGAALPGAGPGSA